MTTDLPNSLDFKLGHARHNPRNTDKKEDDTVFGLSWLVGRRELFHNNTLTHVYTVNIRMLLDVRSQYARSEVSPYALGFRLRGPRADAFLEREISRLRHK